jgi:hypothetical protein
VPGFPQEMTSGREKTKALSIFVRPNTARTLFLANTATEEP